MLNLAGVCQAIRIRTTLGGRELEGKIESGCDAAHQTRHTARPQTAQSMHWALDHDRPQSQR